MSHLEVLSRLSFDLDLFARLVRQRLGRTLTYLVLLATLAAAASTVATTRWLRDLYRRLEPHLDEIPTITIRAGEASADVEQPWVRRLGRDRAGRDVVVIIDTTGARTDFGAHEVGLFLQRRQLLVKLAAAAHALSLRRLPDATVGPEVARRFLQRLLRRVPLYAGAGFFVYYALAKTLQALALGLCARLGAAGRPLGSGARFTVGVYALTPAVLLDCARPFLPFGLPFAWLGYGALAVAYAVLGARRAAA